MRLDVSEESSPLLERILYAKQAKVALILHVIVLQEWSMRAKYWGS
jgi:hypothetical protein